MGNWHKLSVNAKFSVWENDKKMGTVILPIYIDLMGNDGAEYMGKVYKVELNGLGYLSFEVDEKEFILEV